MATSNAIRIHKNGGPEVLQFEKIEVGEPGPEEVLLRHTAIGLNFTDIHHRTGRYPAGAMPIVLGMEAAGVVEEAGANVLDLKVGDRVAYGGASPSLMPGAYTELRVISAALLVKLPSWIDDETAAAVFLERSHGAIPDSRRPSCGSGRDDSSSRRGRWSRSADVSVAAPSWGDRAWISELRRKG